MEKRIAVKKCNINVLILLTIFIPLILLANQVLSQDLQIRGKVISDRDQLPVPGVSVLVKGTSMGIVTDVNGEFQIAVPDRNATLVFITC